MKYFVFHSESHIFSTQEDCQSSADASGKNRNKQTALIGDQ